jgi:hypothetical protein
MASRTSTEILADLKTEAVKRLATLNPRSDGHKVLADHLLGIIAKMSDATLGTTIETEIAEQAKRDAIQANGVNALAAGSVGEISVDYPDDTTLEASVLSGDGTLATN